MGIRLGFSTLLLISLVFVSASVFAQELPPTEQALPAATNRLFFPIARKATTQPATISFWGLNAYLTKVERNGDDLAQLADKTRAAGVHWTREEMVWALIEPLDNRFNPVYDSRLNLVASKGLGVIGVLISTPDWAVDSACRNASERFFCPPADPQQFAQFAGYMAERYDGDGFNDAPGSPRIAAWEIWNEPNDVANWGDLGNDPNRRKERYGQMLVAAHQSIKAADSSTLVVTGGTYIFDGSCAGGLCDGFNFFNAAGGVFQQVPAAKNAFDVFATHPFAHPERPDAPNRPRILMLEGTSRQTRKWLTEIGRPDAPIWITELGWCTAPGNCPTRGVNEEEQANFLMRALVIAQQSGIQHVSVLQLEDAFNNPNRLWGNTALLRNFDGATYPEKPAFKALQTLASVVGNAVPIGIGPAHTYVYDESRPFENRRGTYHYRYQLGARVVHVLWRPDDTATAEFPLLFSGVLSRWDREIPLGAIQPTQPRYSLPISERPQLVVEGN
jgi:hypothetical protein